MNVQSTNTYSILFVDDDEFIVDMYSMKFTEAGHDFKAVRSAKEALEILRAGNRFDAILTDLIMPEMDGFDFLKTVKEESLAPDAVIVVLSNQGEKEDIARAKEYGAVGHIIKANTIPSEVVKIVENIISKYHK